jgi:hypothetical protein
LDRAATIKFDSPLPPHIPAMLLRMRALAAGFVDAISDRAAARRVRLDSGDQHGSYRLMARRVAADLTTGPVFPSIRTGGKIDARLSTQSVADIVKAHTDHIGLDPGMFADHSLRAGFLTSTAMRGASIFKMMDEFRHRSVDSLRGHVRDAEIFKDNAGAGLL